MELNTSDVQWCTGEALDIGPNNDATWVWPWKRTLKRHRVGKDWCCDEFSSDSTSSDGVSSCRQEVISQLGSAIYGSSCQALRDKCRPAWEQWCLFVGEWHEVLWCTRRNWCSSSSVLYSRTIATPTSCWILFHHLQHTHPTLRIFVKCSFQAVVVATELMKVILRTFLLVMKFIDTFPWG